MPPWVAFPSLILLWADVVVSQTHVTGVVGQSVTLPCTYSTAHEIAPMCWGRGPCPLSKCSNTLISTDGYRVTFEKDKRYGMNGIISRGDLSLTIQNAALSDTGTYCCRIEYSGWFNDYKGHIFLEIKPAPTTVPTPPEVFSSAPTTPGTTETLPTAPTTVPTPPEVFSSAPTTPGTTETLPTDGNSTVTQPSDCRWQCNETHTTLKRNTRRNTNKLYIELCIAAIILLTILAAILIKKYLCGKRMVLKISKEPQTGTAQNGTAVRYQAQENIYFENNLYNMPEDPGALQGLSP